MPRLSKKETQAREEIVRELFKNNINITCSEVMAEIKRRTGMVMRPNRVYELRDEAREQALAKVISTPASEAVDMDTDTDTGTSSNETETAA